MIDSIPTSSRSQSNGEDGYCTIITPNELYLAYGITNCNHHQLQAFNATCVSFVIMTNHFHMLLWPHDDGDLSRWMQWLMTSHVRRYHRHYKGSGHVWQGRFKAFPVQSDEHYLTVLRYVERNPLRANTVERSQDWEWSSLKPTTRSGPAGLLHDGPILKPAQWTRHVNGVETEAELKALRHSLARCTPFGDTSWQTKTAAMLGLESSLRPRGRPKQLEK